MVTSDAMREGQTLEDSAPARALPQGSLRRR